MLVRMGLDGVYGRVREGLHVVEIGNRSLQLKLPRDEELYEVI